MNCEPSSPTPTPEPHPLLEVVRDPVRFAQGMLCQRLWDKQKAILRSVASNSRTSVKACHASGKSFTAAAAVLWWVTRYPNGIAVTTAPTWKQVEKVLWGEIHRAASGARVKYPPMNQTELRLGPDNYALGLSTNEGLNFQGFHGQVLIVIDEAPGVLPSIYEAIEGIRAGGDVRVLELGNPTIASGPFYDSFTSRRGSTEAFTISAFDTPNLAGVDIETLRTMTPEQLGDNPLPYLVTRRWVREKLDEWGEDHPLWQSRVLGEFPTQSEDALISLAWLEAAKARTATVAESTREAVGIDVAGPGEDETVVYRVRGAQVVDMFVSTASDPRGPVAAYLQPHRAQIEIVNVDAIGIGYNFGLHLRDLGYEVSLVNVGEPARDKEKYANRKAELYWALRERFRANDAAGLTDERTIAQLAGIRYRHNARGQVVIESKDDARKRGVKSPDRAEALMLAWAKRRSVAGTMRVVGA